MMEIRFLFLTAVIVNAGISSVQPKFQIDTKAIANEVSADNKVQQNLRSLFDSLSKNDMKKTDSLRDVLEREAEREQKAFDMMKEDLRLARGRKAYKQRTSYNSDNGERLAVFKRETVGGNTGTSEAPVAEENKDAATEEPTVDPDESTQKILPNVPDKIDEYYNYDDPLDEFNHYKASRLYDWKEVEKAYEVGDEKFLSFFCSTVHKLAGGGSVKVINEFLMDEAVIAYQDPMYFPTDTQFLQYVIEQPQTFENNETLDHFYVTGGLKENCIFYLIPTEPRNLTSFNMGSHVCGIDRALKSRTNTTSEIPTCAAETAQG